MRKKPFDLNDLKEQLKKPSKKVKRKKDVTRIVRYEDSVVAFIDLLGFSSEIEKLSVRNAVEKIKKLEWVFDKILSSSELGKVKINYFSDCICISETLPKKDSENYLDTVFYFLLGLIHIQGELLFQGILIRGGVSIDRHYSSDKLIFSKGLLRSYRIESQKAHNPVIMLDDSVYEKIIEFHKKKTGGYFNQNHYLSKVDSLLSLSVELPSGEHVLNYLSFWREVDHESYILPFFEVHKNLIVKSAEDFKKNSKLLSKFKWMAEYHNYYLKKMYKIHPDTGNEYLVDMSKTFGSFSSPKV